MEVEIKMRLGKGHMPRNVGSPQKLEETRNNFPLKPPKGAQP